LGQNCLGKKVRPRGLLGSVPAFASLVFVVVVEEEEEGEEEEMRWSSLCHEFGSVFGVGIPLLGMRKAVWL
jgi:hypothetical protein